MIQRLYYPGGHLALVDRADLDEFIAAAFEACNVLAELADLADQWIGDAALSQRSAKTWERLSKWCSE